ncbi:CKLF-like MARVEL transmembrane domain-containing protein 4 [Cydia strobilella]|uniref:CKLF-like MARVEL transmembrane domain-containing protein 4 n=1 Tax=Cydia strobilella TaxID=1100964 RepID=UPI003003F0A4
MYDVYANNPQSQPTTPPAPEKVLRFDRGYISSLPGILKGVQLLCNLIGFICIKVSNIWISSIPYNLLYWICMVITTFLLLSYSFHMVEKYDRWPWLKLEFFYCCVVVMIYIILAIIATVIGEGGYAVGFFGFCAIIAYGFDGFLKYKAWKRGLPPQ